MKLRETVVVAGTPEEVHARLTAPGPAERTLEARSGAVSVSLLCRFGVEELEPGRIRLRGMGVSPRLGFTVDAELSVREEDGGSAVDVDADVDIAGPLAGLGQRELGYQARRVLTEYLQA